MVIVVDGRTDANAPSQAWSKTYGDKQGEAPLRLDRDKEQSYLRRKNHAHERQPLNVPRQATL